MVNSFYKLISLFNFGQTNRHITSTPIVIIGKVEINVYFMCIK